MALTETWIKPEDNATPAALSNNFSSPLPLRLTGRGGGTGLLISKNWKFTPLLFPSINSSFESHSVTMTYPLKINFVVVYRPPGSLVNFVKELDMLLSTFPEDGTPLVILGDFNIQLDKPQAAYFHTLLASFDFKRVLTTATHKSGNQLDLIYTRQCSTDHVLVTPLHTSDHFLLTLILNMIPDTSHTPPHVTYRCNLRSLSPSRLSAMVSSSLPPLKQLSYIDADRATDTFCSTLMSSFDTFCPYLPGQPVSLLLPHGYLSFSANIVLNSGLQKGYGANHKILLTLIFIDHCSLTSLLMSPLLKGHTIMTKLTIRLILACSLKHFPPSFCPPPPPPPPSSTLTADDFGTFFINKITNLTANFQHHYLSNTFYQQT